MTRPWPMAPDLPVPDHTKSLQPICRYCRDSGTRLDLPEGSEPMACDHVPLTIDLGMRALLGEQLTEVGAGEV